MVHKRILLSIVLTFSLPLSPKATPGQSTLTLVCIGKNISQKVTSRQPFMNYLAKQLSSVGIQKGQIKVAENIQQVASMINSGEADIFIDSPFPILLVDYLAKIKYPLRRWKKGVAEYSSVIFTHKDSGIQELEDLKGKMISFEEPFSTTGYFLPKTILLNHQLILKLKKHRDSSVLPSEIGYIFSEGDETTMVWVLRKIIQAGAIDFPNFVEDARDQISNLHILYQSEPIPRHLVAYRSSLNQNLAEKIQTVLLNMDQTQEGRNVLKSYQKTRKFDKIPSQSMDALNRMKRHIKSELADQ